MTVYIHTHNTRPLLIFTTITIVYTLPVHYGPLLIMITIICTSPENYRPVVIDTIIVYILPMQYIYRTVSTSEEREARDTVYCNSNDE